MIQRHLQLENASAYRQAKSQCNFIREVLCDVGAILEQPPFSHSTLKVHDEGQAYLVQSRALYNNVRATTSDLLDLQQAVEARFTHGGLSNPERFIRTMGRESLETINAEEFISRVSSLRTLLKGFTMQLEQPDLFVPIVPYAPLVELLSPTRNFDNFLLQYFATARAGYGLSTPAFPSRFSR